MSVLQSGSTTNISSAACSITCKWYINDDYSSGSGCRTLHGSITVTNKTTSSQTTSSTSSFSVMVDGTQCKSTTWSGSKVLAASTSYTALTFEKDVYANADGTFDPVTIVYTTKLPGIYSSAVTQTLSAAPKSIDARAVFGSISGQQLGARTGISVRCVQYAASTGQYIDLSVHAAGVGVDDSDEIDIESKLSLEKMTPDGSSTYLSFWRYYTPSVSLAQYNPTGTTVELVYTLKTFYKSGDSYVQIGDAVTRSATHTIPTTVIPSCTLAVSDANGYASRFGGYIKRYSDAEATVTPTLAYGSAIQETEISGDGVQTSAGSKTIRARVQDMRGRWSDYAAQTITVLDYTAPQLDFNVHRVDDDGTDDISGAHCKVDYTAAVKSYGVTNDNDKALTLYYKKSTEDTYQSVDLDMDSYSVTGSYTFDADDASSYDVVMELTDTFTTASRAAPLSTGFAIMHFNKSGKGIAFGKLSEKNMFEVGMEAHFYNNITFDIQSAASSADLDDMTTSGRWFMGSVLNGPNGSSADEVNGFLEVFRCEVGEYDYCLQRLTCSKTLTSGITDSIYSRCCINGTWGDWAVREVMKTVGNTDASVNSSNTTAADYANEISYMKFGKMVVVNGYDVIPAVHGSGTSVVLASGLPVPLRYAHTFMACSNSGECCRFGIDSSGNLVIWWNEAVIGAYYNFSTTYIAAE